ncbi:hypothetical protein RHMOL_Rhmol08G0064200 [Rhododendron molle]|uniref:Uncharacterized protein n=1 Tax=Rhododendron molle TaxID=49168 RepID=A0ACC0MLM4_RHOML|nr:hypothetical protein RHMOL_Rhmol08G0064200 [Rhododendron molle]
MEEENQQRKRLERSRSEAQSFSPCFNSYSSHGVAEPTEINSTDFDDGIEFSFVRTEIVGVDEGQDCQIFPIFNRDLFLCNDRDGKLTRKLTLRQLFDDEDGDQGDKPVSRSSAEANELESVPVGTYSVWRPKIVGKKPAGRCEKSYSTRLGWKLRDSLLRRSYSEGTPKNSREHKGGEKEGKLFNNYKPSELTPRLSFKKLFTTGVGDKGRDPSLLSSSGADELESVPMGTYSVWRPKVVAKVVEKSPSRCKKSKACFG